jgi:DNA replication protein DnaC
MLNLVKDEFDRWFIPRDPRPLGKPDMERMWVPRRFWHVDPGRIPPSARTYIDKYVEIIDKSINSGYSLLLSGPNGIGKTCAAVYLLKEARRRGCPGFFLRCSDLVSASFDKQMFSDSMSVSKRLSTVGFLVMDELGKENKSQSGVIERIIDSLLRSRSSNLLPTIITTNEDADGLIGRYSLSMFSIFTESFLFVDMDGEDQRSSNGAETIGVDFQESQNV